MYHHILSKLFCALGLFFLISNGKLFADSEGGSSLFFSVTDIRQNELAYIDVSSEIPYIVSSGKLISVKALGDKIKYYRDGQHHFASIYGDQNKIKLKDENEKLHWKIRINDQIIKICDDDACTSPYEIKRSDNKVRFSGENIALLSQDGNVMKVDSETSTYTVKSKQKKLAYLLLAIEEMSFDHRLILMNELLNRGY